MSCKPYTVLCKTCYKAFRPVFKVPKLLRMLVKCLRQCSLVVAAKHCIVQTLQASSAYNLAICDQIWENWPYGNYCWFELWAKIYTQPIYHGFFRLSLYKKIFCLPPSAEAMPIQARICPGEVFLLVHSFCHWLRITEKCSHDFNVTMATIVAQRPSVCFS